LIALDSLCKIKISSVVNSGGSLDICEVIHWFFEIRSSREVVSLVEVALGSLYNVLVSVVRVSSTVLLLVLSTNFKQSCGF
jgi:hypothetical protein